MLIEKGLDLPVEEAARVEAEAAIAHCESPDVAEGLAAFAEKRRPRFGRS
jgi:enoyl-CoA hydratase/carnithine racemase